MGIYNLEKIFEPATVAVIGATAKTGTIGEALLRNIVSGSFEGAVFPVNPNHSELLGKTCYPSITDVPAPVDLVIIAVSIDKVPDLIDECAKAGTGGVVILSAGGKETGDKGRAVERAIRDRADAAGIRVIGPNCMGIVASSVRLNATFGNRSPLGGRLAFISQSGAMCAAILDLSVREGIGFRYFVSIGSMLDVDFGDLIDYLGHDPEVSAIVLYVESLTHVRKFMSAARAVSRIKPIVVLKAGRSPAGAAAASSHTGAMAGEDAVYDAAFKRAGMLRVETIDALFDCAELFAKQRNPRGNKLCILTNGGGPGVMAADALAAHGLEPAVLETATLEALDRVLPPFWSRRNPIDILGDAVPARWKDAAEICLSAHEVDALLTVYVPQALNPTGDVASALVTAFRERKSDVPLFSVWMGGEGADPGREIMNRASFPTYDSPERAVSAFLYAVSYARNLEMLHEIPPKFNRSITFDHAEASTIIGNALEQGYGVMDEFRAKRLLAAYGIPVNPTEAAATAEEAARIGARLGFPVAMKILSPDITHKSDAGGVELNVKSAGEAHEAFERILSASRSYRPDARIEGVTVQGMLGGQVHELIMGCKTDRDFGPVILFGAGGLLTELWKDYALALPPLNRLLARRLMEETRIYRMLRGYRSLPAVNMELLEAVLVRLAQLVTDFPQIEELDINPFMIGAQTGLAADARVMVRPSGRRPPDHLVIPPYPNQYETVAEAKGGTRVLVRPIKPEDASLLMDLFAVFSPRTIYFRFFSPLKSVPAKMLARLTQIDYDRDMALVAVDLGSQAERILAVARLMSNPRTEEAEFAVVVGDPWQGQGIGAALMDRLLSIASEKRIRKIVGQALAENTQMLALARSLGFEIRKSTENGQFALSMDLPFKDGRNAAGAK